MVKVIYLIIGVKKWRKRIGEFFFFLNSLSQMVVLEFSIIGVEILHFGGHSCDIAGHTC